MHDPKMAIAAAVLSAILASLALCPLKEPSTIKILLLYATANVALLSYLFKPLLKAKSDIHTFHLAIQLGTFFLILNAIFLLTSLIFTTLRRLFLSRLSKFPGPKRAAITKLYIANEFRLGKTPTTLQDMHRKYKSDFIRIGPNELSISCVEAVDKIFKGRYARGPFYELGAINGEGAYHMSSTRNYKFHPVWRKIWEKGLSNTELRKYNGRIEKQVTELVRILGMEGGKKGVDVTKVMTHFTFDVMTDIGFSMDSKLQSGKGDTSYIDLTQYYVSLSGFLGSLRNLCQIIPYLPEPDNLREFKELSDKMVTDRQRAGEQTDFFTHLLAEDGYKFPQTELVANGNLFIAAGAETTMTTTTQALRAITKDKKILRKLQEEVGCIGLNPEPGIENTRTMDFLCAVVNESLRLFNPFPLGSQATTPPSGVEINGTYIPGNVDVWVPHKLLMTDPRYFPQGEEFVPERWLEGNEKLLRDRKAFIPWSYGAHSCVGKHFALNEMRVVIGRIVWAYDLEFGEGYSDKKFEDELMAYALLKVGSLEMKFIPRKKIW